MILTIAFFLIFGILEYVVDTYYADAVILFFLAAHDVLFLLEPCLWPDAVPVR